MTPLPFTIGLAGGTGSGKTTIAAGLAAKLGPELCRVIEADSYYRDLSHLSLHNRRHINFDHPDALDLAQLAEHLRLLKKGVSVTKHMYDFSTHAQTDQTRHLKPAPIMIIEGILIFISEELRRLFDLKLFLDEDADIRLLRRIRRDMAERGRNFESVARQYLEQVRPMHVHYVEPQKAYADRIITPGISPEAVIDELAAACRLLLPAG